MEHYCVTPSYNRAEQLPLVLYIYHVVIVLYMFHTTHVGSQGRNFNRLLNPLHVWAVDIYLQGQQSS